MTTPWQESYISVRDTKLRVLHTGFEKPVLLMLWSGLGATAEQFTPLVSRLPVNIVAVDPPGHGYSDPWNDGSLDEGGIQAIWEALLDRYTADRVYIGGHSYGAYSTLMGTLLMNPRISGVVLFDGGYMGPFDQDVKAVREQCENYIRENTYEDWQQVFDVARKESSIWTNETEFIYRSMMKEQGGTVVPRVDVESSVQASLVINRFSPSRVPHSTVPILLLCATLPAEVNALREQGTSSLATRLTNLITVKVPDSGHDVLGDNMEFVVGEVMSFMGLSAKF